MRSPKTFIPLLLVLTFGAHASDLLEAVWPEVESRLSEPDRERARELKQTGKIVIEETKSGDASPNGPLQVFVRPYWEHMNFNTVPTPSELSANIDMCATPGQREVCTVGLWPGKDGAVQFQIDDLISDSGAKISANAWSFANGQYLILLDKLLGKTTVKPAYLVPGESAQLKAGVARQVWCIIHTPHDAAPGIYHGKLRFRVDGQELATKDVSLRVYPFTLDPLEDSDFGWFYHPVGEVEKELADLHEHGCNAVEFPAPKVTLAHGEKDKHVQIDFSEWEKEAKVVKELGMDGRHLFYALQVARQLLKGAKEFTPEFNENYRDAMKQIFAWAADHKIKLVAWVVDEPRETDINPWNRNCADTIKYLDLFKGMKEATTMSTPMRDKHGADYTSLVPHMDMVYTHPWQFSAGLIKSAHDQKKPFIAYNSSKDRLSFGFGTWRIGATGRWQWHYAFMETKQTAFDLSGLIAPKAGYGRIVYATPERPYDSPAFECTAEGILDYRYVRTLENAYKRTAGKPELETARTHARQVLDELEKSVPVYVDAGLLKKGADDSGNPTNSSERGKLCESLRRKTADALTELNGGAVVK